MWLIVVVNSSHNSLGWRGPQQLYISSNCCIYSYICCIYNYTTTSSNPQPPAGLPTVRSSTNATTRSFYFSSKESHSLSVTSHFSPSKKKRFSLYSEQTSLHLQHGYVLSILDFLKFSVWRMEEAWAHCLPNWLQMWNAIVFPQGATWLWTRVLHAEMQFCCGTAVYPKKFHFLSPNTGAFSSFGPWNNLYYKVACFQQLGLNI